jgi:hypothetical protein
MAVKSGRRESIVFRPKRREKEEVGDGDGVEGGGVGLEVDAAGVDIGAVVMAKESGVLSRYMKNSRRVSLNQQNQGLSPGFAKSRRSWFALFRPADGLRSSSCTAEYSVRDIVRDAERHHTDREFIILSVSEQRMA